METSSNNREEPDGLQSMMEEFQRIKTPFKHVFSELCFFTAMGCIKFNVCTAFMLFEEEKTECFSFEFRLVG